MRGLCPPLPSADSMGDLQVDGSGRHWAWSVPPGVATLLPLIISLLQSYLCFNHTKDIFLPSGTFKSGPEEWGCHHQCGVMDGSLKMGLPFCPGAQL